jgi:hypothetical protein
VHHPKTIFSFSQYDSWPGIREEQLFLTEKLSSTALLSYAFTKTILCTPS